MKLHRRPRVTPKLMLTPMLDMFLLILIYLILNFSPDSAHAKQSKEIRLPKTEISARKLPHIQVEVTPGHIKVNGISLEGLIPSDAQPETWLILSAKLKALSDEAKAKNSGIIPFEPRILVVSDKDTEYGLVDKAVSQMAAAGFSQIYFLAEEQKKEIKK